MSDPWLRERVHRSLEVATNSVLHDHWQGRGVHCDHCLGPCIGSQGLLIVLTHCCRFIYDYFNYTYDFVCQSAWRKGFSSLAVTVSLWSIFTPLAPFWSGLSFCAFFSVLFCSSLCILGIRALPKALLTKMSSHPAGRRFSPLVASFAAQSFLT